MKVRYLSVLAISLLVIIGVACTQSKIHQTKVFQSPREAAEFLSDQNSQVRAYLRYATMEGRIDELNRFEVSSQKNLFLERINVESRVYEAKWRTLTATDSLLCESIFDYELPLDQDVCNDCTILVCTKRVKQDFMIAYNFEGML